MTKILNLITTVKNPFFIYLAISVITIGLIRANFAFSLVILNVKYLMIIISPILFIITSYIRWQLYKDKDSKFITSNLIISILLIILLSIISIFCSSKLYIIINTIPMFLELEYIIFSVLNILRAWISFINVSFFPYVYRYINNIYTFIKTCILSIINSPIKEGLPIKLMDNADVLFRTISATTGIAIALTDIKSPYVTIPQFADLFNYDRVLEIPTTFTDHSSFVSYYDKFYDEAHEIMEKHTNNSIRVLGWCQKHKSMLLSVDDKIRIKTFDTGTNIELAKQELSSIVREQRELKSLFKVLTELNAVEIRLSESTFDWPRVPDEELESVNSNFRKRVYLSAFSNLRDEVREKDTACNNIWLEQYRIGSLHNVGMHEQISRNIFNQARNMFGE